MKYAVQEVSGQARAGLLRKMRTKNILRSGLCLVLLLLVVTQTKIPAHAVDIDPNSINSVGAFLMDASTGEELWSKNPDTQLAPASLTKLMTLYLVYDAMETGAFSPSTPVPIDREIATFSVNGYYSNVPLSYGGTYTVDELIDSVVIVSACGSTRALARLACGTEEAAIAKMNEKAQELGIDCSYVDTYGGSAQNHVTARGMAVLVYHFLKDHPDLLRHTSKASFYFHGSTYYNTNTFVTGKYSCIGTVDGVKTGSTSFAGCCLVTTAYTQYGRVIAVVLKASNTDIRAKDSQKLLNAGLQELEAHALANWKQVNPSQMNLSLNGIGSQLPVYLLEDVAYARLDDLAFLLKDTAVGFSWSEGATVELSTAALSQGTAPLPLEDKTATMKPLEKDVFLDGSPVTLSVRSVNGDLFVPAKELLSLLGAALYEIDDTLQIVTEAYVSPFVDVFQRRFYADSISWAVENQIAKGMTSITFQPELTCTRSQVITFLWRAAGSPDPESAENPFVDVDENRFYYRAVLWGVEQGIVQGMTENTFEPELECTRSQVVTFLYRYEGEPLSQPQEPNEPEEPAEPETPVQPEAPAEPDTSEDPEEPTEPEEPEEAVDSDTLEETEPSADPEPEEPVEPPFTDIQQNRYYYLPVIWAAENNIAQGMTESTFEPDLECTRGQVVTFLYRYITSLAA